MRITYCTNPDCGEKLYTDTRSVWHEQTQIVDKDKTEVIDTKSCYKCRTIISIEKSHTFLIKIK